MYTKLIEEGIEQNIVIYDPKHTSVNRKLLYLLYDFGWTHNSPKFLYVYVPRDSYPSDIEWNQTYFGMRVIPTDLLNQNGKLLRLFYELEGTLPKNYNRLIIATTHLIEGYGDARPEIRKMLFGACVRES